jgi:Ca2+-binding RTX toxin-like protein
MGRRLILLLSAMATMVVVPAGVALAAVLIGTNASENCLTLEEGPTTGPDDITLAGGDDTCDGLEGEDVIYGDAGADAILGNTGKDYLQGGDGVGNTVDGGATSGDWVSVVDGDPDDKALGGPGLSDTCVVDEPAEADTTCEKVLDASPK